MLRMEASEAIDIVSDIISIVTVAATSESEAISARVATESVATESVATDTIRET